MSADTQGEAIANPSATDKQLDCGIIMPISATEGRSADHWTEVKSILEECISGIAKPRFRPFLVSDADDVGIIQKRIVQGVYSSDIVVCDVSAKNSNVMFELGMRLAFDKPTVIIKDDATDYSFDTSIIEHIPYPRDLRFPKIVKFKEILANKIAATHAASLSDPDHSTFLKHFGTFKRATIQQEDATRDDLILEMLEDISRSISTRPRPPQTRTPHVPIVTSNLLTDILLDIKSRDPSQSLELSDSLIEKIHREYPNAYKLFPDSNKFSDALRLACAIAKSLTD
jgi:hypothetical protein